MTSTMDRRSRQIWEPVCQGKTRRMALCSCWITRTGTMVALTCSSINLEAGNRAYCQVSSILRPIQSTLTKARGQARRGTNRVLSGEGGAYCQNTDSTSSGKSCAFPYSLASLGNIAPQHAGEDVGIWHPLALDVSLPWLFGWV